MWDLGITVGIHNRQYSYQKAETSASGEVYDCKIQIQNVCLIYNHKLY